MMATLPEPNPIEGLAMRAISEERQGGFFPDLNPEYGPNQGWVAKDTKIRCFICQRFTIHKYSGWKNALEGCGVWFHKKDSRSAWCWCPQCQIELQEPDEAIQSWLSKDPRYHDTERWKEAEGLTQEKAAELMRTKWMEPAGGPEAARPLAHILNDLGPPPPPHGPVPPGLGDGPPPAPEERAAIEDTCQEEEATRPTATPTTSAIPEPRQDSRDDLKSKVADLQRAVERNNDLVRDYRTYCDELESKNQECFITMSELANEAKELRKEVDKYSRELPLVCRDVVVLKQQVKSLEQTLLWLSSKSGET